ncbi:MAG TPA: SUMF1/EgtB/PvdO family nonheme iron enzyme [Terriglobales bacterium]|nr:SUMF1/EgtB/PvdO family nonheme iron enzyme [Terriglobales bacterium]
MEKLTKLLIVGLFLVLGCVASLCAQTTSTDSNAAPSPQTAGQASDDVTKKITDLVNAGKYAEAQALTTGLLVAYPNDQRLIKTQALLKQLLTPVAAVPSTREVSPSAQPATDADTGQLTGMDKVDYNALVEEARQAQQTDDPEQQKSSLQRFLSDSSLFLQKHPDQMLLWQIRAAAAISLDDMYAGSEAGQKLLAAGAADSNNPSLEHLISQLKLKGWLDQEKMAEAKRNTADSLVNSLGMKFTHVPGTTVVFSVWDTRVQDFQAFVNDTHYDATRDMSSGISGHQGATLLASYVQAHYERLGNSWQNPGWTQGPGDAVTGVSWKDAKVFCEWLTEKERHIGKIGPDQSYRLPTDAEWSIAVGVDPQKADERKSSGKKTISPLGNDIPNAYGIYGLGGSFFQFTEDWYDSKMVNKTARGGSWFHSENNFRRTSFRMAVGPNLRFNDFSFRVVLSNDTQKQQAGVRSPAAVELSKPELTTQAAKSPVPIDSMSQPAAQLSQGSVLASNPALIGTAATVSNTAILHLYRVHQFAGLGLKTNIDIDGKKATQIENGQAIQLLIAPGKHNITASARKAKADLPIYDLDMEAGKEYWVRVDFSAKFFNYVRLYLEPAEKAQAESGKLEEVKIGDLPIN